MAKIVLTVRRQTPTGRFEWWPVRGQRVNLPGWTGQKLWSYRDGRVVFIFEETTGQTLSCGASIVQAREELKKLLTDVGALQVLAQARETRDKLNLGPKPEVKLK